MMITPRGSQNREPIEESGYHLHKRISRKEVILEMDDNPGAYELWFKNDMHSGYVITINDIGYEFVRSVPRTNEDLPKLSIEDIRVKVQACIKNNQDTLTFPMSKVSKALYEGKIAAFMEVLKLLEAAG